MRLPFLGKRRESAKAWTAPRIQFLHEQDGPRERELKSKLSEFFAQRHEILRAYLARVVYEDPSALEVALCLEYSGADEPGTVRDLDQLFARLVPANVHLDVLFLTDALEAELLKVCNPFYERT